MLNTTVTIGQNIILFCLNESQHGQFVYERNNFSGITKTLISLTLARHPDIEFCLDEEDPFEGRTKVCIYV